MWIIRTTYKATDKNKVYNTGDTLVYLVGKNSNMFLVYEASRNAAHSTPEKIYNKIINKFGYMTMDGAIHAFHSECSRCDDEKFRGYWDISVELLEA